VLGTEQLKIKVISDTICPWCYVGKWRLERVIALLGNLPIELEWKPFQLNPTMPREGMNRREYRTRKFGSWEHGVPLASGAQPEAALASAFRAAVAVGSGSTCGLEGEYT